MSNQITMDKNIVLYSNDFIFGPYDRSLNQLEQIESTQIDN